MLMMNMNPAQLSISTALVGSLFLFDVGHATQTERRQVSPNMTTAEISGSVNAAATQVSNTPTSCAVTGKGRTRAFCENYSLLRSGAIPTEKSQYLSTVIVTTVIALLMIITVMAWLSLALIAVAAWARRTPHKQPVEKTGATASSPREGRQRLQWAFRPTLWNTIGASWLGLAWFVGIG
jgi:hypothetical protein